MTTPKPHTPATACDAASQVNPALDGIVKALDGLRFGSVEVIVHEGKVTQIERKEKFRFN